MAGPGTEFDRPYLSYSRIQRYLTCPEQYRLHYVEKLRSRYESASLVFGSIVHRALAALFRDGEDPVEVFGKEWRGVAELDLRYSSRDSWDRLDAIGRRLLEKFLRDERPRIQEVLAVEEPFRLGLTNLSEPFLGVLDLVARLNGSRTLIEFKTASADYEPHEIALWDQLTAYALVRSDVERLAICVLIKTKEPRISWHFAERGSEQLGEWLDKAAAVSTHINEQVFYKRPGRWCRQCEFLPVCLGDKKKVSEMLVQIS